MKGSLRAMMKKCFPLLLAAMILILCAGALAEASLPDGDYLPDDFSFSGGSGRVEITCPRVTVRSGEATATIAFSSPNYTRVVLDGVEYAGEHTEDSSVFEVPAPLNAAFELTGTTTAMSKPHDVIYTLFIRLDAARGEGELAGLPRESSMTLDYAECFSVDYYQGGYALIDVKDGARYLTVPEGMAAPEGLDPAIVVLQKPLDRVYLANTAAMALVSRLGALDSVRFSGTQAEGWYVEEAARAMNEGAILYAGKYSEPDYELLLREGCDIAVENTMLLHTPKVQELLELLDIPVFIDRSSYEPHPLGRTEWIKLYGALLDKQEEAEAFFETQKAAVEALAEAPASGKTVVYFYISTDGTAVVRGSEDYIARMIELGGGAYAFAGMDDANRSRASVSLTMEDFYAAAVNADYLIYNTTIDDTVASLADLIARSALLADFVAVKQGRVFTTGDNLFQATDTMTGFITDIHAMLEGREDGMTFLTKLN